MPVGSELSTYDEGRMRVSQELCSEREAVRIAARVLKDEELNTRASAARKNLKGFTGSEWADLVAQFRRPPLRLRSIGKQSVPAKRFAICWADALRAMTLPVARAVVRRAPPSRPLDIAARQTLWNDGIQLSPADPGPEEVDEAGLGIFDVAAPALAKPVHPGIPSEPLEPSVAYHQRARAIARVSEVFGDVPTRELAAQRDRVVRKLERLNEDAWRASPDGKADAIEIVRGVCRGLEPAGCSLATHRQLIYCVAGRLMELGGLVELHGAKKPDRDHDGARYERIRVIVREYRKRTGRDPYP